MRKIFKYILIAFFSFLLLIIILFFSSEWLFPEWNGSYDLGNNLYMMDWERGNRIIVYCSNKEGRTCYGGLPVIPHNYPQEVYVKNAKANDKWVIVKAVTTEDNRPRYYLIDKSFDIKGVDRNIINCDSIIQSYIISTFDSLSFDKKLKEKNVNLRFDE